MILLSMGIRRHATAVLCVASVVAASLSAALAQDARMDGALKEGRSLATQRSAEALQGIKSPAPGQGPAAVVPHYNNSADGRYQGGKGNPAPAGTQKIIDCAAATPEQLAGFAGTQCAATNFLTKNATTRPAVSISKSDPLISGAQGKVELGKQMGLPSSMTKTTSEAPQCETVIKPGGDRVETAVCHEEGQAREEKCLVGRVIEVDGEFRYECETQVKRIKQVQCDITYGEECTTAPSTEVCPDGSKPASGICTSYKTEELAAALDRYSCPDGTTQVGDKCEKYEVNPASITGYTCPQGYTLSGSSCVKTTTETLAGTPVYSCPAGSTLSGSSCLSTETVGATISSYSCPAGTTLSGSSCVKTETQGASISAYSCPSGYTVSGSSCVKTTTQTLVGTPVYSCPAGSTLSGSSCLSTETVGATISSYSCPAGTTLSGSSCVKTETVAPTTNSTCPSGYTLTGSTCSKTTTSSAAPIYSCAVGYTLSGSSCSRQVSSSATISSYTCPSGYTVNGSSCTRTTTDTQAGSPIYSCPSGFSLSGSTCSKTTTSSATPIYSCAAGYTLSGSSCSRQVSNSATINSYTCPSGFTVNGSSCTRTTTDTQAGSPIYSCPSGFSLLGSTCSKTTTSSATPIYSCKPGGTLSGDRCTYTVTTTSDAIEKFACEDPSARLTAGVLQGGRQTYVCCKETVNNQCGGLEALLK